MDPVAIVVLAAGLGKRMGLDLPKVVVSTRERPLIQHVLHSAAELKPERIVVVTGHKRELVEQAVHDGVAKGYYAGEQIRFVVQTEQRGTGDAVRSALPALDGFNGTIVILYGDVPLIKTKTLEALLTRHHSTNATLSLLSLKSDQQFAYGKVVRGKDGQIEKVVELKDCSPEQLLISELNSGFYAVDSSFLGPAVSELKNENAQKEYYLTDIVERAAREGQRVSSLVTHDADEVQGVNTQVELSAVNRALLRSQIERCIAAGVIVDDMHSLFLDPDVSIGTGTRIGPQVQIRSGSRIGTGVTIEGTALIVHSTIGDGCTVKFGVRMEDALLGTGASVGPFANLRPGSVLGDDSKVGNFVETKNAQLARGVKASHLTYLGDCEIGAESNIGAGTITCNYDGVHKHKTTIGSGVFIGSDSCLVAPITIDDGAYVGAGSVITKNVEKESLAFTRPPLVMKAGWAKRKLEAQSKKTKR
ncbi:MAG: UDP-N-acetylglucosamine diphosphorylase/glucosamine-1-phosphate N-acetyltransferase [Proteobacteria bacterium]|nr:UDP-N-acetylglucosamine diphosphorylase/glucosamine-1-phosphate N-acetyltransferase [Pseudomonadota bacterium]